MKLRITVLPGDGIGPEVTQQAVNVLKVVSDTCGHNFEFSTQPIGGGASTAFGDPYPKQTRESCLAADAVLLGAVGGPAYDTLPGHLRPETGLLQLRQSLGAFANLRPVIAYDATAAYSPLRPEITKGTDILILRELLGGLYFGQPRGYSDDQKSAFNTMRYSEEEVERVARIAFEAAKIRRQKVTSVDKINVLETSRLWRSVVTRVAADYPTVTLDHALVDSFAMQMITTPTRYDVVLTENMFGDILSDEAAVISGSLGLLASASIGGPIGLYEPIHGSAPTIAGKNIANPIGAIASGAMLLRYSAKLNAEAEAIETAIRSTIDAGYLTADLVSASPNKKPCTTEQVGEKICSTVAEILKSH